MPSQDKRYRLVLAAILTALAMVLSLADGAVSAFIPFLPGFKLGLANIVFLLSLHVLGMADTMLISAIRSVLTALISGNLLSLVFSLAGGCASVLLMALLNNKVSIIKQSVSGAAVHNVVQVVVAILITSTTQTIYYLPLLLLIGSISGFAMGMLCELLLRSPTIRKAIDVQAIGKK